MFVWTDTLELGQFSMCRSYVAWRNCCNTIPCSLTWKQPRRNESMVPVSDGHFEFGLLYSIQPTSDLRVVPISVRTVIQTTLIIQIVGSCVVWYVRMQSRNGTTPWFIKNPCIYIYIYSSHGCIYLIKIYSETLILVHTLIHAIVFIRVFNYFMRYITIKA